MLGNNRLDAQCIDGVKRLAHIRGKMRKKVWVNAGDVVLVGLRDYQDGKADVILKYSAEEARALKAYGELPESLRINEATEALGGNERREGREGREKESFFFVFFFDLDSRAALFFFLLTLDVFTHSSSTLLQKKKHVTEAETGAGDDFFDFQDVADI